jgi:hypothetical protein
MATPPNTLRELFFASDRRVGQGLATFADLDAASFDGLETIQDVSADATAMNLIANDPAYEELARSVNAMEAQAASQTAMSEVASSQTAMDEVIVSDTALTEVRKVSSADSTFHKSALFGDALNTLDPTVPASGLGGISNVAASQTAMAEVAASQTAMAEVAASQTAMAEVTASQTAMAEVAASQTAMAEVGDSAAALDEIFKSDVACAEIANVSNANQSVMGFPMTSFESQTRFNTLANTLENSTLLSKGTFSDSGLPADTFDRTGNQITLIDTVNQDDELSITPQHSGGFQASKSGSVSAPHIYFGGHTSSNQGLDDTTQGRVFKV